MIRKIFTSKVFVLFTSLFIIGFFIGYDYAHITYEPEDSGYANQPGDLYSQIEKYNNSQTESGDSNDQTDIINSDENNIPVPETTDSSNTDQDNAIEDNQNTDPEPVY